MSGLSSRESDGVREAVDAIREWVDAAQPGARRWYWKGADISRDQVGSAIYRAMCALHAEGRVSLIARPEGRMIEVAG